jgi:hypothetical protein
MCARLRAIADSSVFGVRSVSCVRFFSVRLSRSKMFVPIERNVDASLTEAHKLMLRAGFIRQVSAHSAQHTA